MPDIEFKGSDGTIVKVTGDKHFIPATIRALADLARAILLFLRNKKDGHGAEPADEASTTQDDSA